MGSHSLLKVPELLLPAGNLHKLRMAYDYGADAVYCGVPRFSLRVRENEFRLQNLHEAVQEAKSRQKKLYFTVNAIPRNSKVPGFPRYLDVMAELKPDALIMADHGLIHITRERHPDLPVHISVQTNTMNYAAVKFWQSVGATRVILSREVTIAEVAEIRQRVPDMELEVFVHGSICIAHSGRCFMSNYFGNRDANQGACNNACRDEHKIYYVANKRQQPDPMELVETDEGTFLMNSKDLRAIEFLKDLQEAGVDSIKVEGRTKNDYYVAMVARSYRRALDDLAADKPFDPQLLIELEKVASRGYFSGFLTRGMDDRVPEPEKDFQNNKHGNSRERSRFYAGCISRYDSENSLAYFEIKTKIKPGDELEVFLPGVFESHYIRVEQVFFKGKPVEVISGGMGEVAIKVSEPLVKNTFLAFVPETAQVATAEANNSR